MSNVAVRVEGLGKRYRIGTASRRHDTLRDALVHAVKAPLRNLRELRGLTRFDDQDGEDVFWALRDVSFEVNHGEVLGIIGRNGAGKSTLLKVLSRITEPTAGYAELYGRVGALLEVGTGFHADLTGRQNVYLNGSILGMDRAYIGRKFDEIVEFAGVERHIDTPVKRYSSGMYLRLAFAVAAFLEPEILVVDEVLAVGDAQFQKKCLGKMGEVAREGRTVLFVSHNMAAVENLCQRGVVLSRGRVQFVGTQSEAVRHYLRASAEAVTHSLRDRRDRTGTGAVRIVGVEVRDTRGNPIDVVSAGADVDVYLHFEAEAGFTNPGVIASLQVRTQYDVPVFLQHNRLTGDRFGQLPSSGAFVCRIPRLPLPPSSYRLDCSLIVDGEFLDAVSDAGTVTVIDGDFYGTGEVPPDTHGCCLVPAAWRIEPA
ncbi:MAG TPA: ABC transporter ATP-binding protein [Longimicrobiaceae bacterium]|nr:ABC transporter ATP-binding protein [Longimicrobiaceae bacterium]